MWYSLRMSPRADPDFSSAATELLRSTSRNLVFVTGGVFLIAWIAATASRPEAFSWKLAPIAFSMGVSCGLTLWLLAKHVAVAQLVWQAGLAVTIAGGLVVFHEPLLGFSYALLPLMAVLTVGWPAGLLAQALVIALLLGLGRSPALPFIPVSYRLGIVLGGAFTGLLGWAATRALLTVTHWSLFSFEQARQRMEEAREQRMELQQVQEDLVQANRELARLSDRLKAMNQVAEEARRAKEEFVANVSHELRTPLNMIIGFSEMITQSPQVYGDHLPPALLADIATIQRNSQHLAKLVDDVLDLSQIETERMALSKEWTSMQETIGDAVQVVRALFDSKGLYLETEVPADLRPLFCDSTRIRQVVINLLSNAGRFTEQGGVRVKAWSKEDDIVVSVSDTGPGIALKDQDRLFEPFLQLDGSIRRRYGGSGLGLSISKRFVEMHGGKMWLESEAGVGTTFYFSLPLDTPLPTPLAGDDARRWFNPYESFEYRIRTRRSKAPALAVVPRFVVLEQEGVLQRLLGRYLNDVEVVSVQDVEQVLCELNRSPAQALIVNAPSLREGPIPMERLANLPYGTPLVACWVPGMDEAARRLGVMRYLIKPVTAETLLSTIEGLEGGAETVLLVDDEPEALQLFARMIASSPRSYRILQATNGPWALNLLRERKPDLVLLDLIMPGMDGFQVLREKAQDPAIRDIPVVVVSSRDPIGEPIVSDTLTVARGGGLSVRNLLACIQAVSGVLSPSKI